MDTSSNGFLCLSVSHSCLPHEEAATHPDFDLHTQLFTYRRGYARLDRENRIHSQLHVDS